MGPRLNICTKFIVDYTGSFSFRIYITLFCVNFAAKTLYLVTAFKQKKAKMCCHHVLLAL